MQLKGKKWIEKHLLCDGTCVRTTLYQLNQMLTLSYEYIHKNIPFTQLNVDVVNANDCDSRTRQSNKEVKITNVIVD